MTTAAVADVETALPLTRKAATVLESKGIENARLEAELLLAAVLGVKRLDLYLQHDRPVTAAELDAFRGAVRRRLRREPVQYILGTVAFRTLELSVDPRVLIPRPETEVLAGAVVAWLASHPSARSALDLGTGSGAIALSLARETSLERIVATDVSAAALEVAASNAERNGASARLELRQGALWSAVAEDEVFDVIVSNPPYVGEAERTSLAPEVRDWEPAEALFAGERGLDVIEPLVAGAPARLVLGGLLALEVGAGQATEVAALAEAAGLVNVRVLADLTGRERIVVAEAGAEAANRDGAIERSGSGS